MRNSATTGMGLATDSVETASNTPLFLTILPFISSAFVPTDAIPAGLRQFGEHQPFTPMINTLRALVTGHPDGLRPVGRDRLVRPDRAARLALVAPAVPPRAREIGDWGFAASKGLAALDEHQVRTWMSWQRWTALAILAHAFLSVLAATEPTSAENEQNLIRLTQ